MENINKLTRLLGADRIMTQEDVQQILLGVMEILKNYKQGTESINEETKAVVNQLLERVVEINNQTVNKAGTILDERLGEVETVLKGLQQMIQDVEVIASNVKDGKDADEERVIEEVVSRIKVDPTVLTVSAQEIRDKLSSLKEDDRLDTSAIKGFDLYSKKVDLDYAVQTLQHQTSFLINKGGLKTVSHDASLSGDGTPENPLKVESTSGLTLQTNGTPNGDQTLLNLQAGTNITLTDNGTGTVTIDATGGSGSPGGSDTQLQYNNAGSFGGISGATTNGTTVTFTTGNLIGADVKANSSAGLQILSNAGTVTALFGAGGGANSTLYGGTKLDYATASTVPYLDASKNLISSAVTPTELGYLSGVTSSIQTQLNSKASTLSGTANEIAYFNTSSTISSLTTATYPSLTELSYVKGVTSSIQTQLDAKGTGSVTSVGASFTGGLISVSGSPVTTTGTLALTVAGTSGGIPYFSSTSAWASSALLAANAIMIGGGAGAAPSTTTTGTGVLTALGVNVGSAGAFVTFNGALGTPSSGTLTNATGLPISGLVSSTSTALGVGSLELGNASDTTLSRSSAGVLAVEGVVIPSISSTNTLTNKTIRNTVEPGTDDTYTGEDLTGFNATATIAQWDAVYLSTTGWALTDADAASTAGGVCVGLAAAAGTNGNPLTVVTRGVIRNDGWTWTTVGAPLYLSTTAGALTETAPSGTDDVVRIVGYVMSDDCIFFAPSNDWITRV